LGNLTKISLTFGPTLSSVCVGHGKAVTLGFGVVVVSIVAVGVVVAVVVSVLVVVISGVVVGRTVVVINSVVFIMVCNVMSISNSYKLIFYLKFGILISNFFKN